MKKLNLGKELSKNAQKKVVGGATITCQWRYPPYGFSSYTSSHLFCPMAVAYCNGQQQNFISCTP